MVLESADPEYFVPHVDLTKVAVQHLARLLGRGRAMEAILGADDFGAEVAERYGWINRALPGPDAIRADAVRFRQLVVSDAAQARTAALFAQGVQTRSPPANGIDYAYRDTGGGSEGRVPLVLATFTAPSAIKPRVRISALNLTSPRGISMRASATANP